MWFVCYIFLKTHINLTLIREGVFLLKIEGFFNDRRHEDIDDNVNANGNLYINALCVPSFSKIKKPKSVLSTFSITRIKS